MLLFALPLPGRLQDNQRLRRRRIQATVSSLSLSTQARSSDADGAVYWPEIH